MNEELDQEVMPEQPTQQYEGDDVSALMTAKERMAQRDSEYSAKFAEFAAKDDPKPTKKRTKSVPKPTQKPKAEPVEAESEPVTKTESPAVPAKKESDKPVREVNYSAPIVKETVDKAKSAISKAGSMSYDDVSGGKTRMASSAPKSDREEFSREFNKK